MDKHGHEIVSGIIAFFVIVVVIGLLVAVSMNLFTAVSAVNVQGDVRKITVDSVNSNGTIMHEVFVSPSKSTLPVQQVVVVKGT